MKIYKCDRCGKVMDYMEAQINLGLSVDRLCDLGYERYYESTQKDLCENCYQTIKEVLEDGEIK